MKGGEPQGSGDGRKTPSHRRSTRWLSSLVAVEERREPPERHGRAALVPHLGVDLGDNAPAFLFHDLEVGL